MTLDRAATIFDHWTPDPDDPEHAGKIWVLRPAPKRRVSCYFLTAGGFGFDTGRPFWFAGPLARSGVPQQFSAIAAGYWRGLFHARACGRPDTAQAPLPV